LAGHSLGAATAGLTSMYLAKKGQIFETHLFGAYGHRCLAQNIANDETNWDQENSYIHVWITDYDIIPLLDYNSGQTCRLGSDPTYYDPCVLVYGKGVELMTLETEEFLNCREVTHEIEDYTNYINNDTRIALALCTFTPYDSTTMCLSVSPPAGYIAFFFFFWFILLIIVVLSVMGCIAGGVCIYRKVKDKDGPIYPFCCCRCCYRGEKPTFAP